MSNLLRPSLNWLLLFVAASIGLELFSPDRHTMIFIVSCLGIIPLAGWLGKATEQLAHKTGDAVGGLINATFGNAAEFIIAIAALRKGLLDVVKASLTGSIIGNILLVMGMAFLVGGFRHKSQKFNAAAVRSLTTSLMLAAIALVVPAVFHSLVGAQKHKLEVDLSLWIAIVLLLTYGLSLLFSLHTHRQMFVAHCEGDGALEPGADCAIEHWSTGKSLAVLVGSTALIGYISEILVGSVEGAAKAFGMSEVFIGVIVVAIIGNAAEHSTAILAARKNRMDMSVHISVGSSIQIALFVTPVLVLASHVIAPTSMDLVFTPAEVIAVVLSAFIAAQIANDGESNWLEGAQLLTVYAILGLVFYFLP